MSEGFNTNFGYYNSPWPGEDGGPGRLQVDERETGLNLQAGETLASRGRRVFFGNMLVMREPDQLYLMTIQALRNRYLGLPVTCRVEKIHPESLGTIKRSPPLKAGPFWPGGLAVHRNGDLHVTYGRWCHRLNPDCEVVASRELPRNRPYNSHIVLDNGLLVMKDMNETDNSWISVLDPDSLEPVCEALEIPEPSVARISGRGNTVYVVGTRTVFRFHWNEQAARLELDDDWRLDYLGNSGNSYGWDPVITDRDVWFMDNGKHRYLFKMRGAGVHKTPVNLIRVSQADAGDHSILPISGLSRGTITNPPFFAPDNNIALAFDSGNSVLRAWRYQPEKRAFQPLWRKDGFGASSHMIYFRASGEIVVNDYRWSDHSVVLDLKSGREKGRVGVNNIFQGVIFPCPGRNRDYYYLTFDKLTRVFLK